MIHYDSVEYTLIYIYAIHDPSHDGLLKIGCTSFASDESIRQLYPNCPTLRQKAEQRIREQTKTALVDFELCYAELAIRDVKRKDGSLQKDSFDDHKVHAVLEQSGFVSVNFKDSGKKSEWFKVDIDTAKKAIAAVKLNQSSLSGTGEPKPEEIKPRIQLRKEQEENVVRTINIFRQDNKRLWDCKRRYGKTLTAYELIKRENYQKVIVITHRPAVEDSWGSDHDKIFGKYSHPFIDKSSASESTYDKEGDLENSRRLSRLKESNSSFIYFASIQDLRGSKRIGGKFSKNEAVFDRDWDLLIIDEAHEGTTTPLGDAVIKSLAKPKTKILSLSGTPYNISKDYGDNVFTWTYVDEQKAKAEWSQNHPEERNPYEDLPKRNIYTFDLSEQRKDSYRFVAEDAAFSFREFFRTWTGNIDKDYRPVPEGKRIGDFVHEDEVFDFLTLISENTPDSNYPFSSEKFRDRFAHTFWIVPGVKEARALSALMQRHPVFKDYQIANIAGEGDVEQPYRDALSLVRSKIRNYPRTITLSCGKLTTGITVPEWTGIRRLSGSSTTSASSYRQAIFRVQSPGVINGKRKINCYVFDFAPDRALRVIAEAHKLNRKGKRGDETNRTLLGEFLNFCPVIAIDGTNREKYDVEKRRRQVKRISVDAAIKNGFEDNSIYRTDAGRKFSEDDLKICQKLSDIVYPQGRRRTETTVTISDLGRTDEERRIARAAKNKPKKERTKEELEVLEKEKEQREEQKKLFDLLRAVSIRLPLLFFGADADVSKSTQLKDFANTIDDESWSEFLPKGLSKELFKDILRFYDEDVVIEAGIRIRKRTQSADELPPTYRVRKIIDIISKFRNPDKETVLTPWRVVNLHRSKTLGGYRFYQDDDCLREREEPRIVDKGQVTEDVFLSDDSKVLEINSKSGLYPLYIAYTFYRLNISKKEQALSLEESRKVWFDVLDKHIYLLCKTKMAANIAKRTLCGYLNKPIHSIVPTKLEERRKDIPRLSHRITNPDTWKIGGERMKFEAVIGNPPYQGNNHQQVYPSFYLTARQVSCAYVSLIFPTGWQEPKNANNLSKLNNPEIKGDHQIRFIDNRHNVFPGISGAEWVNIILWKKGFDNGLNGAQKILTNSKNPTTKILQFDISKPDKPAELLALLKCVKSKGNFISLQESTSVRKPYGLSTDVFKDFQKYHLPTRSDSKAKDSDISVIGSKRIKFIPEDYPLPRKTKAIEKYKVFVPYAWGNRCESAGLGGAYADIIIAKPREICTETYLESGCFESLDLAKKHAKYLMTKFARALLFLNKTSQHSTTAWTDVPRQTYSETWWNESISEIDKHLFEKYNVPESIESFVQKNIQTKDESNIIGY